MKRILWVALLALALPMAAFANSSVDFTNSGGTLSTVAVSGGTGLTLGPSTLVAVNGLNGLGLVTGNLGTLSFTTGAVTVGSLMGPNATLAAGGSFTITGNGTSGIPSGVLFSGSFSGPATWSMITLANGTHNYTLTGSIQGTWYNGTTVNGATVQLTINIKGFFNQSTTISSGDTNINMTVPEPGTLGLLGTGLVGLAGVLRKKLKS